MASVLTSFVAESLPRGPGGVGSCCRTRVDKGLRPQLVAFHLRTEPWSLRLRSLGAGGGATGAVIRLARDVAGDRSSDEVGSGPGRLVGGPSPFGRGTGDLGRDRARHRNRYLAAAASRRRRRSLPRRRDSRVDRRPGDRQVGNYFNQELFGKPTPLPWALEIDRTHRPDGYERFETFHPTFLQLPWLAWAMVLPRGLAGVTSQSARLVDP
jgi:hypothetical protein